MANGNGANPPVQGLAAGAACGCCGMGVHEPDPTNRPGLPSIRFRTGTQPTFLRRMLRRLPSEAVEDDGGSPSYPLASLTTRQPDDPTIALLDAWAVMADVLTFYQERIANEGLLRTATERRSVLELAREIGYELNPGVAASTYLSFVVDDSPGAAATVEIPVGTRVQSVPGPGALPQPFETVEPLIARPEWNRIRPLRSRTWSPQAGDTSMYVAGVSTQLQPGDAILIVGDERVEHPTSERWDLRILQTVTPDVTNDRTLISWEDPPGTVPGPGSRTRGPLGGTGTPPAQSNPKVFALRTRAALFGFNAPEWDALPEQTRKDLSGQESPPAEWPGFDIQKAPPTLDLDASYPSVRPGGWISLTRPGWTELYRAESVAQVARSDFLMSARITKARVDTGSHLNFFAIRETAVLTGSDELAAAATPITEPVAHDPSLDRDRIVLDGVYDGLGVDQPVALTVERTPDKAAAPPVGEVGFIAKVGLDPLTGNTVIELRDPIAGTYDPATLLISANVVEATHGESVRQVLGSGDATKPNQSFSLKRPPLTYVPAATSTGAESTLTVRVEDVAWSEARSLYERTPRDEVYVVRIADSGAATVTFGDGASGSRLPTGQDNVIATYRTGTGPNGEQPAGAINQLQSRPLGVRSVENPVPASGSDPPERLEDARQNAPITVLTLDRMVSVQDYEDFARAFAGIGKAQARAVWNGASHVVHVTVAGTDGKPIENTSVLFQTLADAMDAARDPVRVLQVAPFTRLSFRMKAVVLFEPDRLPEDVRGTVEAAVRDAFAFARRGFGQPVLVSEVIAVIQRVAGVVATDVEELYVLDDDGQPVPPPLSPALVARQARLSGGEIQPAELLLLADDGVTLEMKTP